MCACIKSACRLLDCCWAEMYATCLPYTHSTFLRKVTLGCLPRKTSVQRTYVRPLVSLNSYLHVTCVSKPGSKFEKLWNCLTKRPRTVQMLGDAIRSNSISRRLQNSSERVTPLTWPGRPKRRNTGKPMSKNSLLGTNWYWGRVHL